MRKRGEQHFAVDHDGPTGRDDAAHVNSSSNGQTGVLPHLQRRSFVRKANSHAVLGAGVIALGVLAFAPAPASAAPFAVLSDWVGVNNTTAPNDYGLISPTSAGGIFEERKTPRAQFAD